jgi:hypothetical protein
MYSRDLCCRVFDSIASKLYVVATRRVRASHKVSSAQQMAE